MYDIPVPQLLLQPLAENAVFHGIEPSGHDGKIIIHGQRANGKVQIAVEDDGVGMDEAQLAKLQRTISAPMEEETGCGLWNVNQRLNFIYGEEAGIKLQRSELGGLKVTLTWKEGEAKHV